MLMVVFTMVIRGEHQRIDRNGNSGPGLIAQREIFLAEYQTPEWDFGVEFGIVSDYLSVRAVDNVRPSELTVQSHNKVL